MSIQTILNALPLFLFFTLKSLTNKKYLALVQGVWIRPNFYQLNYKKIILIMAVGSFVSCRLV